MFCAEQLTPRLADLLRSHIKVCPNYELTTFCWLWIGRLNRNNYGRVAFKGAEPVLHRLLYNLANGIELPKDMVLDHLCRVRHCCNPAHMEPVSIQVNTRRGNAVLFTPRPSIVAA
jgi:HNH endonuclease